MSNVTALSTSKGIVVVDSHYKPDWGRKIRGIIEEAFHRKDFVYLIYTHAGVDHMGGRPAFPDAELIGHDNCITQTPPLSSRLHYRPSPRPKLHTIRPADLLDHFLSAGCRHGRAQTFYPLTDHVEICKSGQRVLRIHDHFCGERFRHHKA